jgi:hypothetical protein
VNRARAHQQADREEVVCARKLASCKQAILARLRRLPDGDHLTRSELYRNARRHRDYFDAAIAEVIDDKGEIARIETERGEAYTLSTPNDLRR